jgi:hypothetical protein
MAEATRSRRSGRELAGWVVAAGRRRYWMKQEVTVTARRREADALRGPAPPLTASAEGKALRKLVLGYSQRPSHVSVPKHVPGEGPALPVGRERAREVGAAVI